MNKVVALAKSDLKITVRRGEALILNLIVPMVVLVALAKSSTGIEKAMPFAFVQATLATAMVSLGITTGFDRRFRVLVRLGTTPLGRRGLVSAKVLATLIAQLFQLFILSGLGFILGWRPDATAILMFPLCWIASYAFAGIALFIAGQVRAEANLGLQNMLYLVMMGFAGLTFADISDSAWRFVAYIVPSGSLHSMLRGVNGIQDFPFVALAILIIEAIVLPLLAARRFSFDES